MLENIAFKEDLVGEEQVRSVTIADDEPSLAPALKMEIAYLNRAELRKLTNPISKKKEATDDDENKFRRGVAAKVLRGWSGVCFANLCRLSDKCFTHAATLREELIAGGYPDMDSEIEFSLKNAYWIAEMLNGEVFQRIIDAATDQEAFFYYQRKEMEKNS